MVPPSKLERSKNRLHRMEFNALQYWLNSTPDGSMIVLALEKIGHRTLAASLRESTVFYKPHQVQL